MTAFILAAAALLALGCAFIAWPLLRRADAADGADRGRTNVDLYRQRVQEIDYDRDIGTISAAQAAALTTELAGTLLDDAVVAAPATEVGGRSVRVALALAVTLVITAVGLYRYLGAYDEVALAEAAQVLRSDAVAPVAVADLVKRLRTHLAAQPSDAESWYLLGHALLRNDDAPGAVTAFEALVALVPDEAGAAVALAQARYIADDGVITPANRTLIDTIIASDPTQTIVNEMLALSAFQAADYAAAVRHLEQALAGWRKWCPRPIAADGTGAGARRAGRYGPGNGGDRRSGRGCSGPARNRGAVRFCPQTGRTHALASGPARRPGQPDHRQAGCGQCNAGNGAPERRRRAGSGRTAVAIRQPRGRH